MRGLTRFGISMESDLLKKFDSYIRGKKYTNRSEAVRDLVRNELVKMEWQTGTEIAGAVTILYNHHAGGLMNKITEIQHEFHHLIISALHVHIDHENCLEIIAIKGAPDKAGNLLNSLRALKGIKHAALSMSTTGKNL